MPSTLAHPADTFSFIALHNERPSVKPARLLSLIPGAFGERVLPELA